MTEPSNVKKARIKSLDLAKRTAEQRLKEEHALSGIDKIKFEISHLENIIRNCKFDLDGAFKNNIAIQEKLRVAEQQLMEKQEELKNLVQRGEAAP
jgi:hypothetical protein